MMRSATARSAILDSPSRMTDAKSYHAPAARKLGECLANARTDAFDRSSSVRDDFPEAVEQVNHAGVADRGDGNARLLQACAIVAACVAQGVELRRVDDRARQAAQIEGAQRRDARIGGVRAHWQVMEQIVIERCLIDEVADREFAS